MCHDMELLTSQRCINLIHFVAPSSHLTIHYGYVIRCRIVTGLHHGCVPDVWRTQPLAMWAAVLLP